MFRLARNKRKARKQKEKLNECGGPPGPQHDLAKLAACPRPSIAVAIDPATMRDTVIATTSADAKFSNATMVLTAAGQAWFGTFSGNKIARAPLR